MSIARESPTSRLWRHPDFLKLWSGQTVSVFGSLVGRFALPLVAVVLLQASPIQMSLLQAAESVPALLIGLVAGVWVDRLPRRPIMIWADYGRALILAMIPLLAFLGVLRLTHLFAIALVVSVLTVFFDVAYQSYLPVLVNPDEILEANAKLQATNSVAEVTGFGIAGVLVKILTAPGAILVDSCSFLVSALSLGLIRKQEPPPVPEGEREAVWQEAKAGMGFLLAQPVLRALAGSSAIIEFGFNMNGPVFWLFVINTLRLDPVLAGMIFAVGGLTSLLGAVIAGPAVRRFGVGKVLIAALTAWMLAALLIPLAGGPIWLVILMLAGQQFGDAALTVYNINETSLRQTLAPERMLGRVNATNRVIQWGAMLLGTLLGGLFGEWIGLRATLFVSGGSVLLAVLLVTLSPVRKLRTL